jgi:two-component system, NarL family, nitrate/nitrite response regulator NarL
MTGPPGTITYGPMRVVLVEDHLTFRDSLKLALHASGRFQVVGEAASARDALKVIAATRPDLLILDVVLVDGDGLSLLGQLKRARLQRPTLMLTRIEHPRFVRGARKEGALGYVLKSDTLDHIFQGLEAITRGESYLSPMIERATRRSAAVQPRPRRAQTPG